MTAFTEKLDRAAGAATCAVLEIGGASLIGSGVVGLAAGGAGVVPLAAGAAAVMASNYIGCQGWDPNQGEPSSPLPPVELCYEGASDFQIRSLFNGQVTSSSTPLVRKLTDVVYVKTETDLNNDTYNVYRFEWVQSNGVSGSTSLRDGGGVVNTWVLRQDWEGDPTCTVPGPKPPVVDIPPFDYTDPEDGCELTVNFQGFASGAGGNANPVFKIEPNAATRAESDVIGGCNFQPVIYMGDPNGGPPYVGPWNPDWDQPDSPPFQWEDDLKETANICSNADVIKLLYQLLVDPLSGNTYALNSVCELDEQGNPKTETVERTIPSLSPLPSIATRLDALVPLLQAQKDFKQPVCPPVKPEGEFRTIGFVSEEVSPNGKSCLRKRLRYRSKSGLGLDSVIDWWKDFQFNAGPVTVKHRGSSWGTITVWASSADEGKRVIRHAAGEAGIDADQTGRWEISGSSSSRLGMPGTMRVNQTGGYYWITARDGSDNRPLVGKT
jgi:hypothetical protein